MTTWTQKLIEIDVQLTGGSGSPQAQTFTTGPIPFGGSTTITAARASVRIRNAGAPVGCEAEVKVWGLSQSLMNQLATLGLAFNLVTLNQLTVKAGDASGMTTVFQGTVYYAYGDYERAPDVPMVFGCRSGVGAQVARAAPNSFQGSQSVAQIMQTIAGKLNLNFQNNGVNGSLSNAYVEGTLFDQARQIAQHAGISWTINGTTLTICPRGGTLTPTGAVPLIAPPPLGAMIGYPAFTQQGIIVKTVFNPQVQFLGQIMVQSSIPQANGTWGVNKLDHDLDSLLPHGHWMSTCYAYRLGQTVLPPQ